MYIMLCYFTDDCGLAMYVCGQVRMYMDGSVVHSFVVEGPISALRFGSYGREVRAQPVGQSVS
jgi:hypothetical protein